MARKLVPHGDFMEIYCKASLDVCEKRDVKGLYQKARDGKIKDFTGISSPYEVPETPDLCIDTASIPLEQCVDKVIELLKNRHLSLSTR